MMLYENISDTTEKEEERILRQVIKFLQKSKCKGINRWVDDYFVSIEYSGEEGPLKIQKEAKHEKNKK